MVMTLHALQMGADLAYMGTIYKLNESMAIIHIKK